MGWRLRVGNPEIGKSNLGKCGRKIVVNNFENIAKIVGGACNVVDGVADFGADGR